MEVVRIGDGGAPSSGPVGDADQRPLEADGSGVAGLQLVLVTWRDAWFDFDQSNDDRADYLVTTAGFVVRDGPRFVSVAQELLPDGDGFRAVTHIPRSVIESIVPLGRAADAVGLYSADPGAEVAPDRRRDA